MVRRLGHRDHREHRHHRNRGRDSGRRAAPAFREGLGSDIVETRQRPSPIVATVDFDKDGVQHGFLRLPYSRDDSAWCAVMIPLPVAKNGAGPTALLTGGTHGAAYEGPIALFAPATSLDPAHLPT